jgi:hypothetical protein
MDIELSHSPNPDHYVTVEHEGWHGDLVPEVAFQGLERGGMLARLLESDFPRTEGPRLRIAKQLQQSPIIINMPALKHHFAGQITSALKNHFGSVYSPHRWLAHVALQQDRDYFERRISMVNS